jgi:hypothetical protein
VRVVFWESGRNKVVGLVISTNQVAPFNVPHHECGTGREEIRIER